MHSEIMATEAGKTLAAYLREGRLPHAVLLEGPEGELRQELTLQLAAGALCAAEPEARPCGECRDCVKAVRRIHPDLLFYGGEGGARSFHIDTVREIRQQAFVKPNEAECKVLALENVQELSPQAQNALLKIMEEPPGNVYFVLTCENKATLLPTVLSRVAVLTLGEARGGERDSETFQILYDACVGNEIDALAALSAVEKDRPGLTALLKGLEQTLRDVLVSRNRTEREERFVEKAGLLRLMRILAIIEDTNQLVAQNAGGLLVTTALCARIRSVMAEGALPRGPSPVR